MTPLEVVQRCHPQKYDDSLLRTLQRRVRTGNASCGKAREMFFSPEHPPGNQGFSDFTNAAVLRVMISGDVQLHLLHQFDVGVFRMAACQSSARWRELHGPFLGPEKRHLDDGRRARGGSNRQPVGGPKQPRGTLISTLRCACAIAPAQSARTTPSL
jgi:hypothetical protein